jgi:hypothetical protein
MARETGGQPMTFSCSDFTVVILGALDIDTDLPVSARDNPAEQARLAIAAIARLKAAARRSPFVPGADGSMVIPPNRPKLHVDDLFDAIADYRDACRRAGINVRLIREAREAFVRFATEHGLPIDFTDPEDRI